MRKTKAASEWRRYPRSRRAAFCNSTSHVDCCASAAYANFSGRRLRSERNVSNCELAEDGDFLSSSVTSVVASTFASSHPANEDDDDLYENRMAANATHRSRGKRRAHAASRSQSKLRAASTTADRGSCSSRRRSSRRDDTIPAAARRLLARKRRRAARRPAQSRKSCTRRRVS